MTAPFAAPSAPLPVTVVTHGALVPASGAAVLTMATNDHAHDGGECLVCATRGNVRVQLFDLLERVRSGALPPFTSVLVDARGVADPQAIIDALVPGRLPAFGLRDHTVARSFRLAARQDAA